MKICVFGTKKNTRDFIDYLSLHIPHKFCLVTLEQSEEHFKNISGYDLDISSFCRSKNIHVHEIKKYNLSDKVDLKFFQTEKFDLGLSIGWQRLIPSSILSTFRFGVFGWHGSLFKFPNGRGRSPLNWSIRLGANKIFLNLFKYAAGVDNGPVFSTNEILIQDDDYISDLQVKVLNISKQSALKLISTIENRQLNLRNQPPGVSILFPKLSENSGELSLSTMEVHQALNVVRSCSRPFPGAYTIDLKDKFKLRVWRATRKENKLNFGLERNFAFIDGSFYLNFIDGQLQVLEHEILQKGSELPLLLK